MSTTLFIILSLMLLLIVMVKVFQIDNGSITRKPVKFSNDFYQNLEYFRFDFTKVIAVKKNQTCEVIYDGTPSGAKKYFQQVQMGFEEWLKENKMMGGKFVGTVKFD